MKTTLKMIAAATLMGCAVSCGGPKEEEVPADFKYLIDEFADLKIMRYRVPGWNTLTLKQKEYVYHLSEAAKYGRDILWDQNCAVNLPVRHVLEDIIEKYDGDKDCQEYADFLVYAKRVFFSNGIHHHYAEEKFFPECSREYFASLMAEVGDENPEFLEAIYSPTLYCWRKTDEGDIVKGSSVNFYEGVNRKEVDDFYAAMADPNDPEPISYGLNSKLVKGVDGVIREEVYRIDGLYGPAISKIVEELELASYAAESELQKQYIACLLYTSPSPRD